MRIIRAFEKGLYPTGFSDSQGCCKDILDKKTLDDDLRGRIKGAIKEYKDNFLAEHGEAKLKESAVQPLTDEEKKKEEQTRKA